MLMFRSTDKMVIYLEHSSALCYLVKRLVQGLQECEDLAWLTDRAPGRKSHDIGELGFVQSKVATQYLRRVPQLI